jgi:hypothetical protein
MLGKATSFTCTRLPPVVREIVPRQQLWNIFFFLFWRPRLANLLSKMSESKRLTLNVVSARGHGPNGLLPHEEAWVEVWPHTQSAENASRTHKKRTQNPLVWNECISLKIESIHGCIVHVRLRGTMRGHPGEIDEIGQGNFVVRENH